MRIYLLLTITLVTSFLSAQSPNRDEKKDKAISSLNSTEFIETYKIYKTSIEDAIREFKSRAYELDGYKIETVRSSYEKNIEEFDKIAESMKVDLLDKNTRELIIKTPSKYAQYNMAILEKAFDNFNRTTNSLINQYTGYEATGLGVMEIQLLLSMVGEVASIVKEIRANMKKMDEIYFEEYFIKDLRLKRWENI